MGKPRRGDPYLAPTMYGRWRGLDHPSSGTSAAERVDYLISKIFHAPDYAIIGSIPQVSICDIRDCDNRKVVPNGRMDGSVNLRPEAADIFERLDELGLKQRELAGVLDIEENKISKVRKGERRFSASEVLRAQKWLGEVERQQGYREESDSPDVDSDQAYVSVRIVPSFAGAGGGGTGEGDQMVAKMPRRLIEEEFRGHAGDFELIDVRGDSMAPDFHHGDQILIDLRDRNPRQPGPFVLWDDDGYVVKLVERVPGKRGFYRIFSVNERYSSYEIEESETTIRGRPVWFARRL